MAAISVPQQPPIRFEPVLGQEPLDPAGHLVGAERVARAAIDQFGQAGIGLHREQAGPVGGQPAHMLGHFLRAGGAVEADQRHVERVHHGGGGGDVGADQQGAGGLDGDLHEDRRVGAGLAARAILAPLTAALICSGSWQVSIRMASTPPAIRPRLCSARAASSGS